MPIRKPIDVGEAYDFAPIDAPIAAERQKAKRHYGVHPYFTRRPHNVVRRYIQHYSRPGDRVLDPFGGSGVTAIEAFLENRHGIQNDINPFANFVASGVVDLAQGKREEYLQGLSTIEKSTLELLQQIEQATPEDLAAIRARLTLPPNVELPKSSDVAHYHELFTERQLYALAALRMSIDALRPDHVRKAMLLAWSATLPKLTRTFLSAEGRAESRGGSSIFSIYRYKVAAKPVELPAWQTFHERALNIIAAKDEIDQTIELRRRTGGWFGEFETFTCDILDLAQDLKESVDYVFTDPPYGAHIAYLDLSVLWNVWLGQEVSEHDRERELIVGGELDLSESWYVTKLRASTRACLDMLRPDRWFSLVFQHWNFRYFEAILDAAEEGGADLRAAISQVGDPIWSMHKKKNRESVLAGELILTFYNRGGSRRRATGHFDMPSAVRHYLARSTEGVLYGEELFNHIVVEAWREGAISALNVTKDEFTALLREEGWEYSAATHQWHHGNRRKALF